MVILNRSPRRGTRTSDSQLSFVCNICSSACTASNSDLHREEPSCRKCNSNVRFRSVIAALSCELHGRSLALDDFPPTPHIIGLGTSDWEGYAMRLRRVLRYDNTYYDEQTRLDIMAPVPAALAGSCDFIVSSDVLEHVAPPIELALSHLKEILKPGGVLVLTVPMKATGSTVEHFPDLHEYEVVSLGEDPVLVNRTRSGDLQVFDNLIFHGGPGLTLEMRMISLPHLLEQLSQVGFVGITEFNQSIPEHGIEWIEPSTWPILAHAPI